MTKRIGFGLELDEAEFLRRGALALRGCDLSGEKSDFLKNVLRTLDRGIGLSEAQLVAFCRTVVRLRSGISDKMVTEYAALRVKQY